jgi:hypothetical protein
MPDINRLEAEYQCPESVSKCNFVYCDARHRLKYRVEDRPSGLKLKVIEFTSEDVIYNKRFKVISRKD